MATFDSISSLVNHASGNVANIGTNFGGKSPLELVEIEAKRLADLIRAEIKIYMNDYDQDFYVRTKKKDWLSSVRVGKATPNGNTVTVYITFEQSLIMHPSWNANGGEDGNVGWLMEVGVTWGKSKGIKPNKYSNWGGTHYLKNAVNSWNKSNKYGMTAQILYNGEVYYSI